MPLAQRSSPGDAKDIVKKLTAHATATKCVRCSKTVYQMEQLVVNEEPWHKQCFRCTACNRALTLSDFGIVDLKPYCSKHALELNRRPVRNLDDGTGASAIINEGSVVDAPYNHAESPRSIKKAPISTGSTMQDRLRQYQRAASGGNIVVTKDEEEPEEEEPENNDNTLLKTGNGKLDDSYELEGERDRDQFKMPTENAPKPSSKNVIDGIDELEDSIELTEEEERRKRRAEREQRRMERERKRAERRARRERREQRELERELRSVRSADVRVKSDASRKHRHSTRSVDGMEDVEEEKIRRHRHHRSKSRPKRSELEDEDLVEDESGGENEEPFRTDEKTDESKAPRRQTELETQVVEADEVLQQQSGVKREETERKKELRREERRRRALEREHELERDQERQREIQREREREMEREQERSRLASSILEQEQMEMQKAREELAERRERRRVSRSVSSRQKTIENASSLEEPPSHHNHHVTPQIKTHETEEGQRILAERRERRERRKQREKEMELALDAAKEASAIAESEKLAALARVEDEKERVEKLALRLNETKSALKSEEEKRLAVEEELAKAKNRLGKMENQAQTLQEKVATLEKELDAKDAEMDANISELEERLAQVEARVLKLKEENLEKERKLETTKEEALSKTRAMENLEAKVDELSTSLTSMKNSYERELSELKRAHVKLEEQKHSLEDTLEDLELKRESAAKKETSKLEEVVKVLRLEMKTLTDDLEHERKARHRIQREKDELSKSIVSRTSNSTKASTSSATGSRALEGTRSSRRGTGTKYSGGVVERYVEVESSDDVIGEHGASLEEDDEQGERLPSKQKKARRSTATISNRDRDRDRDRVSGKSKTRPQEVVVLSSDNEDIHQVAHHSRRSDDRYAEDFHVEEDYDDPKRYQKRTSPPTSTRTKTRGRIVQTLSEEEDDDDDISDDSDEDYDEEYDRGKFGCFLESSRTGK